MLIFGIYTRCQQMKVKVRCGKFECREDIHFKTQPVAKNATPRPLRLGIEPAPSGSLDQRSSVGKICILKFNRTSCKKMGDSSGIEERQQI